MANLSEQDLQHLNTFSARKKAELLQTIMAKAATQQRTFTSNTEYDHTLIKLRQDGYGLIDFQPMETALTSVWYRNTSKLLGLARSEAVVMLLWELSDQDTFDFTALMSTWEL